MSFAYITADRVGAQTGGGVVTFNERGALESLGEVHSPLPDWLTEQGGDVWRPDKRALTWSYGLDVKLAHFYAGTFSDTVSALKARKVKVAYTAAAHDVGASRAEHERLGVPFDYPHLNDPALWRRYVSGYLAADLLVCPSTHSKGVMVGFGADPKKITVIPHGVDFPEGPARPMPAQFTVGYLGAIGPDKGLAYLLQAWKKLAYTDALLVIAGRDTTSPFMRQVVDHFGGGMVHLRGWVRDVADFYGDVSLYVQPSVCLLPGSLVFSRKGMTAVDDLVKDDKVLTNSGYYKKVIRPTVRHYRGDLLTVRTIGLGVGVSMTPAHRVFAIKRGLGARKQKFLERRGVYEQVMRLREEGGLGSLRISKVVGVHPQTIEGWFRGAIPHDGHCGALDSLRIDVVGKSPKWVAARDLEKGDVVLFPRTKKEIPKTRIRLPQKIKGVHANGTKPLPPFIDLDLDVMRFFGLYVAEGCASGYSNIFCFHTDETEFMAVVEGVVSRLGLHSKRTVNGNSTTVRVESMLLTKFLVKHFGRGSHNVHMPPWVMTLPPDQLRAFIRGAWEGDGSKWAFNDGRRLTDYTTVSRTLAYQMFAVLVRLGYMPKLHAGKIGYDVALCGDSALDFATDVLKRSVDAKRSTRGARTAIDDDYYYMPVSEITKIAYQGNVFNLEVKDNHNYCAPFVVHNSEGFGCEVLEAMAHGRAAVASTGCGASDLLPKGWTFPPRDVDALAALIDHFKGCKNLDKTGEVEKVAASAYSWTKIRKRYVEAWEGLLGA